MPPRLASRARALAARVSARAPIFGALHSWAIAARTAAVGALSVSLLAPAISSANAQPALPAASTPLPIDSAVRVGQLENGLRYFIRVNGRPAERAELRLAVNAGSALEDDDQRGLAHFLEHMAFNGTTRFAKNDIVKYLESIGVRFGADLNAYTGFDETVYILPVPTDSAALLESSFDILKDWASAVLLDSAEVVAERGVVLEEWRGGRGAGARVRDQHLPVLFTGSRYADRLPIGDTGIIRSATPAPLRRFYTDWYRPNNMAIIAVGDFDADRVESLIKDRFSKLRNPDAPRERAEVQVPSHSDTYVSIAGDDELPVSTAELIWKLPQRRTRTVGEWRQRMIEDIYNAAFNRRLNELSQKPESPWVGASSGTGSFARASDAYNLSVAAEPEKLFDALRALLVEARRVDEFGFLASEIDRVKQDLQRSYERGYAERDRSESGGFANSYVNHFLTGAAIPGITYYNTYAPAALASISLEEVNAVGRAWISDTNRVLLASIATKDSVPLPTREQLLNVLSTARELPITAWTETLSDDALVAAVPTPGTVVSRATIDELDVTEWTLSNGVRVLLKTTDFKADEVLMGGFSTGGTSLLADDKLLVGELATTFVERGGVGDLSLIDLNKKLAGKVAQVGVSIGDLSQEVSGRASPKDLETLFQLTWLRLTAPRADTSAVKALKQQLGSFLANRGRQPEAMFSDTITLTLGNGHPRVKVPTAEAFGAVELEEAMAIYRDRFANANGFTFLFVGNVSADSLEPLLVQWLAALPSTGEPTAWRDVGIRPPPGVVEKVVRRGVEPKANTIAVFHGEVTTDVAQRQAFRTLGDIAEARLLDRMREALGGTYSVDVSASVSTQPRNAWQILVQYGSSPENADTLFQEVLREFEHMRTVGPTDEELNNALEKQRRALEVNQKQNAFWLGGILTRLRNGQDPRQILEGEAIVNATTKDAIIAAARVFMTGEQYARFTLLPEAATEGEQAEGATGSGNAAR